MKRALCLLTIAVISVVTYAQGGQDFALRFMQQCREDTAVHCITVSPRMMEQMLKTHNNMEDEATVRMISKLKSARIVTANHHAADYYDMAVELMEKNKKRFQRDKSFSKGRSHGCFYTRSKDGVIVELVMIQAQSKANKFVVINLTGTIDKEFISNMTRTMDGRTARLR